MRTYRGVLRRLGERAAPGADPRPHRAGQARRRRGMAATAATATTLPPVRLAGR